jgi:hypothetical protein
VIPASRALEIAHEAARGSRYHDAPGNLDLTPVDRAYRAVFTPGNFRPDDAAKNKGSLVVDIDAASGQVLGVKERSGEDIAGGAGFMSAMRAYQIALAALQGFEGYDKMGRHTIELETDTYRVTFPLPATMRASRRPDYAMQVWVEGTTGRVLKVLAAP